MEKKEPKMKDTETIEIGIETAYKLLKAVLPNNIESAQERDDAFSLISMFNQMICSGKHKFKVSASLVQEWEKNGGLNDAEN
jgi:hypothetical protein